MLRNVLIGLRIRQPDSIPVTRIFYLQPEDDLTTVLDRLSWSDAQRVVFVVPPDSKVLSDRLDLVRLQRFATNQRVGVALVTAEPGQWSVARELGVPVFASPDRALEGHWRLRRPSKVLQTPHQRSEERPHPAHLRPGDSRIAAYVLLGMTAGTVVVLVYDLLTVSRFEAGPLLKDILYGAAGGAAAGILVYLVTWLLRRKLPRLHRWLRWTMMTLVFAFGLLAPVVAAYVIVPGARLTITPDRQRLSAIARITVVVPGPNQDSALNSIDFEGQRIAGRRVSAEVGGEAVAAATGSSEVPSSRATGAVVFSNLLAQDYTVGSGTAVRTSAGSPVRYLTTGDVTVPPLGQAAVGIEALEPGPQGNVGIGLINRIEGAAARAVRVTNPEPTRGGGVSQVRAVTQKDRDELRRTVLAGLESQGYQRVLERPAAEGGLREGEYLVPGSVRIFELLHETFDRFATEEAESVKLEMRVLVTGVVVDLADAYNLARYVLNKRVPGDYELVSAEFRPGLMGDNVVGEGTMTFFVEADGMAEAKVDHDEVKTWLRGEPLEDGKATLSDAWARKELPVADLPEVEIWPDWAASRFPWLIWRIEVTEAVKE